MKWTHLSTLKLAAVALAFAVAGGPISKAEAADSIRIGLQSVPPDEVYKARDWGQPYNLDLDLSSFSSGSDSLKAFLANRVDVANGGSARLVTMAAQQPETFYIVAANQYGGDRYGLIVATASDATSIEDLKGKKIGAVTGSGTYNTFLVYLEQKGLSESDFQIVNMKVEDLRAAVQQGIIDAAVAWEPHVAIAETMGAVKRIASMKGVNQSPNFVLVRRDFADANPDIVAAYVATLIDLAKFIEAEPQEAGRLAAERLSQQGVEVKPEALELALTRISMNPQVKDELLDELVPIAQSMKDGGRITAIPDFKSLVRTEYYDKAVSLARMSN